MRYPPLTDHDGLYGSMQFAQVCKANDIRPITGAGLTIRPSSPPFDPFGRLRAGRLRVTPLPQGERLE